MPSARQFAHLCVDVQNMFAEDTEWSTPWLNKMLPAIEALVDRDPSGTIFTRFIPPQSAEEEFGGWSAYYRRWPSMTRQHLPPHMVELVPTLRRHVPPANVFDKNRYSPWLSGQLDAMLRGAGIQKLLISGGETDVCVLATVLGAIDLGYHVVLATDAVFGSANQTHDAVVTLFESRFGQQLTACPTQDLLSDWERLF